MSKKVAVLACSNAGLDYLDYPSDITILRSVIHFGTEETYNDFIEMDAKAFYERISKEPNNVPKTSYASIGTMLEIFEDLKAKGYDEALVITISGKMSGLNEALRNLARQVEIKLTVYDSKTIAYPQAFMVLEAHRLLDDGKTVEEILPYLDRIRDNNQMYFAVDTLLYLVKNGRLSRLSGTLGTMLKIKPLLTINKEGAVETVEKIKTSPKALQRVLDKYFEETKDLNVLTYISHAHNDEAVKFFTEAIHKVYPKRKIVSSYLTPVVGAHAGPKAIGLGYIDIDKARF